MTRLKTYYERSNIFFATLLLASSVAALAQPQPEMLADDQTRGFFDRFYFVSSGMLFQPLIANVIEGRIGLIKDLGTSDIRLDIGNSVDVIGFTIESDEGGAEKLALGADFIGFALIYSKSEKIILQVNALDAVIGGHISYLSSQRENRTSFSARLRISHMSSHFADGHYDSDAQQWRDGMEPRPFGREFVDLVASYRYEWVRFYAGTNYAFRVRPELPRMGFQAGIEFASPSYFDGNATFYVAHDLKLVKLDEYSGANTTQAGLKIGKWRGRGIDLFLTYYRGLSVHGEYFDRHTSYLGAGFLIAFG